MRQWASNTRKEKVDTKEKRRETAESTSNTSRLASLSAASYPMRNECPGTHCSLIVQEGRKGSFC